VNALTINRLGKWFKKHNIPLLPNIVKKINFLIFNCHIDPETEIGKGTVLGYGGMGIVIHKRAKIGKYTVIAHQVTIGAKNPFFSKIICTEVPTIGSNVYIGSGSKILGDIVIGDNVVIGVNSVVTKSVESNTIVAGVPAKVIKKGIVNNAIHSETF